MVDPGQVQPGATAAEVGHQACTPSSISFASPLPAPILTWKLSGQQCNINSGRDQWGTGGCVF